MTDPALHTSNLLAQNDRVVIVLATAGDTYASLAERYLGSPGYAWLIAQENGKLAVNQGDVVVIRRHFVNAAGLSDDTLQTVPILTYHNFGHRNHPLTLAPEQFRRQLEYLKANGYQVVSLADVPAFLAGRQPLPPRAVVLTIDDGYRSTYELAYPLLAEFGFTATLFVYSDYINNGGVTWAQLKEMDDSGVIDVQPHSKTHRNLNQLPVDDGVAFLDGIRREVAGPKQKLERREFTVFSYAFPFGATNGAVNAALRSHGYQLGLTVDRGANRFYADPYLLRRTMIYRGDSLETFAQALAVTAPLTR